jgi:hypothetical protein
MMTSSTWNGVGVSSICRLGESMDYKSMIILTICCSHGIVVKFVQHFCPISTARLFQNHRWSRRMRWSRRGTRNSETTETEEVRLGRLSTVGHCACACSFWLSTSVCHTGGAHSTVTHRRLSNSYFSAPFFNISTTRARKTWFLIEDSFLT